jgi:DNA-binding response OmpR family regulator
MARVHRPPGPSTSILVWGRDVMHRIEEIATIIVCEDDEATLELLCDHLITDHFEVLPAPTGADALRFCHYSRPDLLILDLALPDMPAIDVIKKIREADGIEARFDTSLPIIVLGERADRLRSSQLGADEYLRRPIDYGQLKARIAAILRRRHNRHDDPITVGEVRIDPGRRMVTVGDRQVQLSRLEFTLLRVLATDPTRVFSKNELLRDVWGFKAPAGRTRTLDSQASRLRKKLDPEQKRYVVNCWGIGYSLVQP